MANINIQYAHGAVPNPAQQADIQYAAAQWANLIQDAVTINVQVWATSMAGTGLNGICIPGVIQTHNRTLTRPQAKAQGILGAQDVALDLVIAFDINTPWVLGTPPVHPLNAGQFSLSTTMMHELCHGLGFLGLCNVDNVAQTGTYTAANTLLPLVNNIVGIMNPQVVIPAHFFPALPVSGFGVITPFANLFQYTNGALNKGTPADDYTAFTSPFGSITANGLQPGHGAVPYTVWTGAPFMPFTTCDHIGSPMGLQYLMEATTQGLYLAAPDAPACDLLRAVGWTI